MAFPLPTLVNTWDAAVQQNVLWDNTALNAAQSVCNAFLLMKNCLIEPTVAMQWSVWQSCDGAAFGAEGDGVDRWLDIGDVTTYGAAAAPHCWVVLEIAIGAGTMQVCLDLVAGADWAAGLVDVVVSPSGLFGATAGGTDGDASNRPQAPDEYVGFSGNLLTQSGVLSGRMHCWISPDGKITRVVTCRNGFVVGFLMIEALTSPRPDWIANLPTAVFAGSNATDWGSTGQADVVSGVYVIKSRFNNAVATHPAYFSYEGVAGACACYGINTADAAGGYNVSALGTWSNTVGSAGKLGMFSDIWLSPYPNGVAMPMNVGDTAPVDGSRWFVRFGPFLLPWDTDGAVGAGVVPLLA